MEGDEGNKIKIKNTLTVKIGIFLSPLGRTVHDIFWTCSDLVLLFVSNCDLPCV